VGPERDDAAKRHPYLVPHELPESEKHYDRDTAMESTGRTLESQQDPFTAKGWRG
jgi:hypothetical protein